jgi:hypothetical protein
MIRLSLRGIPMRTAVNRILVAVMAATAMTGLLASSASAALERLY